MRCAASHVRAGVLQHKMCLTSVVYRSGMPSEVIGQHLPENTQLTHKRIQTDIGATKTMAGAIDNVRSPRYGAHTVNAGHRGVANWCFLLLSLLLYATAAGAPGKLASWGASAAIYHLQPVYYCCWTCSIGGDGVVETRLCIHPRVSPLTGVPRGPPTPAGCIPPTPGTYRWPANGKCVQRWQQRFVCRFALVGVRPCACAG